MSRTILFYLLFLSCLTFWGQRPINYEISFDKAAHHEAKIKIRYTDLNQNDLLLSMSRSSPGRYALHEFAKNVYDVKATDADGQELDISRPNPHQWLIAGHSGTVVFEYTLFADRADGTYSQVDLSHAHLNMPATFVFARSLADRPMELKVILRQDLNWKVATQLKKMDDNTFYARDLQYFMDSPMEISDHQSSSFDMSSKGRQFKINFVLHQLEKSDNLDLYMEKVEKIVRQQKAVFKELPPFDYDQYTFLACYAPNVDGDGMEHRNSTVITSRTPLENGGLTSNIGTVAHEFFHAWNVERIRPLSLEPFDFERANMSGELWFAEGFTSYYTMLTLCRAGLISRKYYAQRLGYTINSVVNAPGRKYHSPVQMSYQAPFVDAATSVDPVNRENTFISYYTYGNLLGLCLDLSLRNLEQGMDLDQFMQLAWERFGKKEIPFTLEDLQALLAEYAGNEFSDQFFESYIHESELPDLHALLGSVGISLQQAELARVFPGAEFKKVPEGWMVVSNPIEGQSFFNAGISRGDLIKTIQGKELQDFGQPSEILTAFSPGQTVTVMFERHGRDIETEITWTHDPTFRTDLMPHIDQKTEVRRNAWLEDKTSE